MARRLPLTAVLFTAAAVLTGCGDDADDGATATTAEAGADDATTPGEGGPALPDACGLVPDAAAVSGLDLGEGAPDGDDRRRVCAFSATEPGQVGLTVAVQGGKRFDQKTAQSESALGVEGEPVDGIGDRALFFFSDEDLPEGVGGVLVGVRDLTLEVTLQGLDEVTMRRAATALAELAVSNL
ncbi:MAG: hypothetical protein H0V95_08935 [Actinobacteria bacterium]|nr:hypothetical protein [Actinomycetota bacterium]